MYAANESVITTYIMLQPDPSGYAAIFRGGSDFLAKCHLLYIPDIKNKQLIDGETKLTARGSPAVNSIESMKVIIKETSYHDILAKFPSIITSV